MELIEAQARQAIVQLREVGWAAGPPAQRDEWRSAVRAFARREGMKIRTGEAIDASGRTGDNEPRPWAATVEGYEAARAYFGGMDLDSLGTMVVTADAGRRTRPRRS